MARRKYRVHFFQTRMGAFGPEYTLKEAFAHLHPGPHTTERQLPQQQISGRQYQIRNLRLEGDLWCGVFGKLRDDAPNKIDKSDHELGLDLDVEDRLLEKSYFVYHPTCDVLVWQLNTETSYPGKLMQYVGGLMDEILSELVYIPDTEAIERGLHGKVKVLEYTMVKPPTPHAAAPDWTKKQIQQLAEANAAKVKVQMYASAGGLSAGLMTSVLPFLKASQYTGSLRVTLEGDAEPIDLIMPRISTFIDVTKIGHYSDPTETVASLRNALLLNAGRIGTAIGQPIKFRFA